MVIERLLRSFATALRVSTAGVLICGSFHREAADPLFFACDPLSALEEYSHEE